MQPPTNTRKGLFAVAEITPFSAVRYDFAKLDGDVSKRIAPPYDVLDAADKQALLANDPTNIVEIDLPHAPAKALGPAECYTRAADVMNCWLADGTLIRENTPAIYAYDQTFEHDGTQYTRRKFFARLRLQPFDAGTVLAHEDTFGGPKEDRLALMKATSANLSPIFGLYTDPKNEITAALEAVRAQKPDAAATLNGVQDRLWIVTDKTVIDRVVSAFAPMKVYIADGHHRYTTSLTYRDWVTEQNGGQLPADHPANFIMMCLASMDDPGSLILPTHRVLSNLEDMPLDTLADAWSAGCAPGTTDDWDMILHHGATGERKHLRFSNRAALDKLEPNKSAAWRSLDVAYLHSYLIDELFTPALGNGASPTIHCIKSESGAIETAKREHGIALICKTTTMEQLRGVSDAFDRMPQKSTFFYPKIATGMVVNMLK